MDATGYHYDKLSDIFKHRTTELPAAIDGGLLINALKTFVNWMTWMTIDAELGIDHQFVQGFFCTSGLDR